MEHFRETLAPAISSHQHRMGQDGLMATIVEKYAYRQPGR
jgi:hypothetical protein